MVRVRFQPLRISKRPWRPWRQSLLQGVYGRDAERNGEKRFLEKAKINAGDDFEDFDSDASSSRSSSGSYDTSQALLPRHGSKPSSGAEAYVLPIELHHTKRRRCNQYFTIIVGSILILTILLLLHLASSSAKAVAQHKLPSDSHQPWEEFPRLQRYFGGIRSLTNFDKWAPEYPRASEELATVIATGADTTGESSAGLHQNHDILDIKPLDIPDPHVNKCQLDTLENISLPRLKLYNGVPQGFPSSVIGNHSMFGLQDSSCMDRFNRFGPYGYGYSERRGGFGVGLEGDHQGVDQVWADLDEIDYRQMSWNEAQTTCSKAAKTREAVLLDQRDNVTDPTTEGRLGESVLIVRTTHEHTYSAEEILNLRALMSEVSFASGGLATVHFLVEVPDSPLSDDRSDENTERDRLVNESLPREFHNMGSAWTRKQMETVYGPFREGFSEYYWLPLQRFADEHPEIDWFWNWELNIRSTTHYGALISAVSEWAKAQPRKELWDRNSRFYIPYVHGDWEDFKQLVHVQTQQQVVTPPNRWATISKFGNPEELETGQSLEEHPVWGPRPPLEFSNIEAQMTDTPPSAMQHDKYSWGVDEEPDLLVFSPIFDPTLVGWPVGDMISGYEKGIPPLRATNTNTGRFSRRLLLSMSREITLNGHILSSSLGPATTALHYGFKAVSIPHPVYIERMWPPDYLNAVINGGNHGVGGRSVFSKGFDTAFEQLSWNDLTRSSFATRLWKRWLGTRVDLEGGEDWEMSREGRLCLPPMLLRFTESIELV